MEGVQAWSRTVTAVWDSSVAAMMAGPGRWPGWVWGTIALCCLTSFYFLLFAVAMYLQELKSYAGRVSLPKMMAFSLTWMNGSLLCSLLCVPDLLLGRRERAAERVHYYGSLMGQFMFRILSKPPIVVGLENLPPDGEKGMVYVSNHQTSTDIALFYYIGAERKFSWVSKSTVFLIPGVGLLMKIARYVALTRGNRDSVIKMFDDCKKRLESGWSVMIFPQGTRRRLKILDFKDGAFQLAIDSNSVVVSVGPGRTVGHPLHSPLPSIFLLLILITARCSSPFSATRRTTTRRFALGATSRYCCNVCLVGENVKTRRAPSRRCRGARVCGHTRYTYDYGHA